MLAAAGWLTDPSKAGGAPPTKRQPSDEVRSLQRMLSGQGYDVELDGISGPKIEAAKKDFEAKELRRQELAIEAEKAAAARQAGQTTQTAAETEAIDAWCTLHDSYGKRPLEEILLPAIKAAEEGWRVTPRVAWDWAATRHGSSTTQTHKLPIYRAARRRRRAACSVIQRWLVRSVASDERGPKRSTRATLPPTSWPSSRASADITARRISLSIIRTGLSPSALVTADMSFMSARRTDRASPH